MNLWWDEMGILITQYKKKWRIKLWEKWYFTSVYDLNRVVGFLHDNVKFEVNANDETLLVLKIHDSLSFVGNFKRIKGIFSVLMNYKKKYGHKPKIIKSENQKVK